MSRTLPLDVDILHGGTAQVVLPAPPAGHRWCVEWRVVGAEDWHAAAWGLDAGEHLVPDTDTPEPQHRIEWRAVAEDDRAEPRCTVCGAAGAVPQRYAHPDFGPVALCGQHRDRELDWI